VFKEKISVQLKKSRNSDIKTCLEFCLSELKKEVETKYVIDIFSDGTDELKKMLRPLWRALKTVLTCSIIEKSSTYFVCGTELKYNDFIQTIINVINNRYLPINAAIKSTDFLSNKTEDDLFSLYTEICHKNEDGFSALTGVIKFGENEQKLNALIGLNSIKESIKKIKAYALSNKDSDELNIHMCFLGNPGSGKTEVARIIAGILYENKILPTDKIVETDRSGLVGQYVGETPQKTMDKIQEAMGGVLFIDEAYSLVTSDSPWDYGHEAVSTLIKAMEDYRGKFCVILAGYKNEMLNMILSNPGFKSRIQFTLDFPNYSRPELESIAKLMLEKRKYTTDEYALDRMLDITDIKRKDPNFANAREIRNILDQVIMCQNLRCVGTDNKEIGLVDVNSYIQSEKINIPSASNSPKTKSLSGEEELDTLVGLSQVKRMIKKIKAYAKKNYNSADFNMHMCFFGNPGTGKTEVARILSKILYEAGVLDEAKLVETDAHGLIGKFVGETAPKTKAKINEAMNGVLFIDEAYALYGSANSNDGSNYADEAVSVLIKEMEDHRGQFCVILAGYKDETLELINSNPGFESRIQFKLDFPDYSKDELGEIAKKMLDKKHYDITPDALSIILAITDVLRTKPNFANARTMRNILDQVIMNQNLRTEDSDINDMLIIEQDVYDYIDDEGIDMNAPENKSKHSIGFI
ncbi:MAG: AAA family ATPase, partial [Oscillospiraceae bacterium]|nr:AAA family ATPase [Oscillospiraceae bacterium]